ncbi:hypothetical protein EDB19DRAFT_1835778 [Suillus lakei]|nr:hypothetical protein EDB19DRAFT_1835778 [Suillus lakei]
MTPHLHTPKPAFGEMGTCNSQTNKIENNERAVTTNGSPEANARVPHIDPQIHTADIVKAMRVAAVKCAVSKINRQVMPNSDGEDGDNEEDEEEEDKEKKEDSEDKTEDKDEKKNKDEDVKEEDE